MNFVFLSGRLATDVDYRLTKSGKSISKFRLAVQRSYKKDKDGKYQAHFFSITTFDKTAEHCRDHLIKGRSINLKGHLVQDNYKSKKFMNSDGEPLTVYTQEVVGDIVEFLGYRKQYSDGSPKEDNEIPNPDVGVPPLEEMALPDDISDEEIPF